MALYPKNDDFRGLSICSGLGGLDLGLQIAKPRFRTVCYIERDSFASSVLVARMAQKALCDAPIWDDLKTFDCKPWRDRVDIILAGYPCQPFAFCGKRLGKEDPRHLWPDIAKIIKTIEPQQVFLENVKGHVNLGFPAVLGKLQRMGYRVAAGLFSARECGASHFRLRLFILADADHTRRNESVGYENNRRAGCFLREHSHARDTSRDCTSSSKLDDPLAFSEKNGGETGPHGYERPLFAPSPCDYQAWERELAGDNGLQPCLFGLDHGVASRMERSYAIGNGVVPLAAAFAYKTLSDALQRA